ncbi:MAG: undecaprenyl-diphosphate phosphatase [Firmicutes bacterium]|nr:undecaprenyl-diphosphate phosphatase [Bacillota bacterium]
MSWWQAVILGIVQGATEFIPVSSSGHLILFRDWIGVGGGDFLLFDLLVHLATLGAVFLVFYKDIGKLFKKPKYLGWLVLATIPAGLIGLGYFLLRDRIPFLRYLFETPNFLWIFFLITAILLFAAELYERKQPPKDFFIGVGKNIKGLFVRKKAVEETIDPVGADIDRQLFIDEDNMFDSGRSMPVPTESEQLSSDENSSSNPQSFSTLDSQFSTEEEPFLDGLQPKNVAAMGLMQMAAIIPGISRSGSTIFGGVMTRGKRKTIAKFSFLMSIPIILAGLLLETIQLVTSNYDPYAIATAIPWYGYVLSMIAAFVVGFAAIKWMLKLIAKADFKWFALYVFALSIFSFFFYFLPSVS